MEILRSLLKWAWLHNVINIYHTRTSWGWTEMLGWGSRPQDPQEGGRRSTASVPGETPWLWHSPWHGSGSPTRQPRPEARVVGQIITSSQIVWTEDEVLWKYIYLILIHYHWAILVRKNLLSFLWVEIAARKLNFFHM